jgi:beta-galactosidase
VCDGLLFPDRNPSPGLIEYKNIITPVVITGEDGKITVRSKYAFADTAHLAFKWRLERDGILVKEGTLDVPPVAAGKSTTVSLPDVEFPAGGEVFWTVTASLAADTNWAKAGHEVAWGQVRAADPPTANGYHEGVSPVINADGSITLGPATFTARGQLVSLGDMPVEGGQLDVWRAPTDNDSGGEISATWPEVAKVTRDAWKHAGLNAMEHRLDQITVSDSSIEVVTRVAACLLDRGLATVYTYTADGTGLRVHVAVTPEGSWDDLPLPRLGVQYAFPASLAHVKWFGCGPSEAYPDTRAGARVGAFENTIDGLQTPYVMPQDNGTRMDVRSAELASDAGEGLRIDGSPVFHLTARRWTHADLEAAKHTVDLVPRDKVWVNVDHAVNGIGSASCGPMAQEQYRVSLVEGHTVEFAFALRPL